MMRSKVSLLCALTFVLVLTAIPLKASDPVGIYCIVDKVVLEPNETEPTSVQIWGAFALATAPFTGNTYRPVETGYLYYTCPKGRDSACLNEWADLKSLAGKNQVIGFGDRYGKLTTRVRKADEKPASPDIYPLNIGLVKMGHYAGVTYPDIEKALKDAMRRK